MTEKIYLEVVPLTVEIFLGRIVESGMLQCSYLYGEAMFSRVLSLIPGMVVAGPSPDISMVVMSVLWGSFCYIQGFSGPSGINWKQFCLCPFCKSLW